MDFAIATNGLTGDLTWEKSTDIGNNVFLSLAIIKGAWWFNPEFGMRDTRRLKNTEKNARLVADWVKEALRWLLDMKRATNIEVETERDTLQDPTRLKAVITVTQANGVPVTFEKFFEVV